MATTNTTKNPPKSTPILLSTACDRRSCIAAALRIPCCFGHPPRSATPPGGAAARARHASGRFSRCAPSAATQERVADPESPAQGPGSSSSAPPGSSQHHRAHAVAAGKSCGLPEGHGPPSGCPPAELTPRAPLSPPSRVSLRPVLLAAAAGCWLLVLLAPTTSGWGGPVAQPHHIRRLSSAHGARLGPRTFSGQSGRSWVHGHHITYLPTCPPPPPTFWASRYAAVERVAPDVRALLCENYA